MLAGARQDDSSERLRSLGAPVAHMFVEVRALTGCFVAGEGAGWGVGPQARALRARPAIYLLSGLSHPWGRGAQLVEHLAPSAR